LTQHLDSLRSTRALSRVVLLSRGHLDSISALKLIYVLTLAASAKHGLTWNTVKPPWTLNIDDIDEQAARSYQAIIAALFDKKGLCCD
jgi:hypothetical protein